MIERFRTVTDPVERVKDEGGGSTSEKPNSSLNLPRRLTPATDPLFFNQAEPETGGGSPVQNGGGVTIQNPDPPITGVFQLPRNVLHIVGDPKKLNKRISEPEPGALRRIVRSAGTGFSLGAATGIGAAVGAGVGVIASGVRIAWQGLFGKSDPKAVDIIRGLFRDFFDQQGIDSVEVGGGFYYANQDELPIQSFEGVINHLQKSVRANAENSAHLQLADAIGSLYVEHENSPDRDITVWRGLYVPDPVQADNEQSPKISGISRAALSGGGLMLLLMMFR